MSNVYEMCFYGGLILTAIFLSLTIVLFVVFKIPKVFNDLTGRSAKKDIKGKKQRKSKESSASKKEQAKYYNQSSGKITVRDAVSQETIKANRDDTTDDLVPQETQKSKPKFKPQFDSEETMILGVDDDLDKKINAPVAKEEPVNTSNNAADEEETDVLRVQDEEETDVLKSEDEEETDVLRTQDEEETDVLRTQDEEETDVLREQDEEETDVLREQDEEETDVLRAQDEEPATDVLRGNEVDEADSTTVLATKKTRQLAAKAKVLYNIVVVHTNEKV